MTIRLEATAEILGGREAAAGAPAAGADASAFLLKDAPGTDLIARGLSNAEIAEELFLAEQTVKTHVRHLLTKLDLRD